VSERGPDHYATIQKTCERYSIGRSTFYRMLSDPLSGLAEVVVRIPPMTGRLRVPERAFEAWLSKRNGGRRRT
jgi:hypothetical protein